MRIVRLFQITDHYQRIKRGSCAFRYLSNHEASKRNVSKTRNIGIMAHIDAGKTTTTERMLYYAGVIQSLGEVHKGDTVMDYMDQERARGITITSASITFSWMDHEINLVDTPGHVDFTTEVEKALRVLDGAVTILDASAGVEAQTMTVWRQADRYHVPRIIYLNKMDKPGAKFTDCLNQIESKLKSIPLPLHYPIGEGRQFKGIVDLVNLTIKKWEVDKTSMGAMFSIRSLTDGDLNNEIKSTALEKRLDLIGKVADLDDELAGLILERESFENITPSELEQAIRRVTLEQTGIAVLCGSSYKNIGVQPLMDSIVSYLPSPKDRHHEFVEAYSANNLLCALAFKIQNDLQRGPLTFLRIYSGNIETGDKVYNVTQSKPEKTGRLYIAKADELAEVSLMSEGSIAVVSGLKQVVTGDTITSGVAAMNTARHWLAQKKSVPESEMSPVLAGVQIPEPVFFCSIETSSLMYEKPLEQALAMLQREDPSLKVTLDSETGQTVIAGMGELHLEVILERIRTDYRVDASFGPYQVAYKETTCNDCSNNFILDKTVAGIKNYVQVNMSLELDLSQQGIPSVELGQSKESREHLATVSPAHLKAIKRGISSALSAGPLLSFPVTGIRVFVNSLDVGSRTTETMIQAAGAQCVAQLLRSGGTRLMEPFMRVEISIDGKYLHAVLADFSQHRADILDVTERNELKVVVAESPLSELRGYSKRIRILTSGTATFSMEFSQYKLMTAFDQSAAMKEITGISM